MNENKTQSGMTLVEVLVAMVMMGIVITGVYNLFRVHNLMAAKQEETTLMQQELLSAMAQIAEDIRMCGYSTGSGSSVGFNTNATNSSSIYCTKEETGSGNNTDIGYMLDADNNEIDVFLNSNSTWEAAASNISDLNFTYIDQDGTAIPIPIIDTKTIRYVDITATAQATESRAGLNIRDRTMNTRVYCRNMGI